MGSKKGQPRTSQFVRFTIAYKVVQYIKRYNLTPRQAWLKLSEVNSKTNNLASGLSAFSSSTTQTNDSLSLSKVYSVFYAHKASAIGSSTAYVRLYDDDNSSNHTNPLVIVGAGPTGVELACKISDLIKINFEKFNKNKKLIIKNTSNNNEPEIIFKDEIMYALGNIIQNAILYSKTNVTAEINYNNLYVKIIILDDGDGFSKDIIDRLGEPYISKNNQGMGLGIFIAKNLIENMGGRINFYNSKEDNAIVEIIFDNSILNI